MKSSAIVGIFSLCIVFFILGLAVGIPHAGDMELINSASEVIRECEYALPRNQHCEIVLDTTVVNNAESK